MHKVKKNVPGRRTSMCKSPEAVRLLAYRKQCEKVSAAPQVQRRGAENVGRRCRRAGRSERTRLAGLNFALKYKGKLLKDF